MFLQQSIFFVFILIFNHSYQIEVLAVEPGLVGFFAIFVCTNYINFFPFIICYVKFIDIKTKRLKFSNGRIKWIKINSAQQEQKIIWIITRSHKLAVSKNIRRIIFESNCISAVNISKIYSKIFRKLNMLCPKLATYQ